MPESAPGYLPLNPPIRPVNWPAYQLTVHVSGLEGVDTLMWNIEVNPQIVTAYGRNDQDFYEGTVFPAVIAAIESLEGVTHVLMTAADATIGRLIS